MPWFYQIGDGEIVGPVDLEALHQLTAQGAINGNTQVSFAESGQTPEAWQLAHSISSLNLPRVNSPRAPQRPTQPPPNRLPADDPRVQTGRPQRRRAARPGISPLTFLVVVFGCLTIAVGGLGVGWLILDTLQFGGPSILEIVPLILLPSGLLLIVIAILFEILRVNRATLSFLEWEQEDTQPPAKRAFPAQQPQAPHPLD